MVFVTLWWLWCFLTLRRLSQSPNKTFRPQGQNNLIWFYSAELNSLNNKYLNIMNIIYLSTFYTYIFPYWNIYYRNCETEAVISNFSLFGLVHLTMGGVVRWCYSISSRKLSRPRKHQSLPPSHTPNPAKYQPRATLPSSKLLPPPNIA